MTTITLSLPDLVEHQRRLGAGLMPALRRGLMAGGLRCIPILHRSTRDAPPANPGGVGSGGAVNYGDYLRAWKVRAITDGIHVFNDRPQAGVIEKGRRPGSPPPPTDAIMRWAQRKLTVKTTHQRGPKRGQARERHMTEKEARRIAFAIARSIGKRGLRARNVMGSVVEEMRRVVFLEVLREYDAALGGT